MGREGQKAWGGTREDAGDGWPAPRGGLGRHPQKMFGRKPAPWFDLGN